MTKKLLISRKIPPGTKKKSLFDDFSLLYEQIAANVLLRLNFACTAVATFWRVQETHRDLLSPAMFFQGEAPLHSAPSTCSQNKKQTDQQQGTK